MTAFSQQVYGLQIVLVEPKIINDAIAGVRKRISRERNHWNRSVDEEFRQMKQEKIDKLIAIKKQLKLSKRVFMYQYVKE